ncbi:TPA: ribosome biogenesis/translation initiation ATPase RLI [Candidatus Woesearchaeota archaeon]|nr:ribosome biogenesis/translation initiation ATPase RLI [Candidatus Woesearchaeota archaeon]
MTRIAIVDNEKLRNMQEKLYIQSLCPVNRTGKECIRIDGNGKLTIEEKLCTGCGICPKAAPLAIKIINLPEKLKQKPIHRYGENQFVLYSMPTPLKGRVTGVLGVNGIGKSTALRILAKVLQPNFGDWTTEGRFSDIIPFFKGTEAQKFFEELDKGVITVSYKPQQVELIPKTAKGSVKELLKKVDQRGKLGEVAKELQLDGFLENDIREISGGELQRVAIAAAVLKDASLYIFDEPSSYLDIRQRINISRFIKGLANQDTSVLLVEHDLIILDYMTDLINIMYGREAAYGIVSGVKPTKAGINIYLGGYLKEENVRFRDAAMKFTERPPMESRRREELTSWKGISKKLGRFSLEAKEGTIYRKDIIGVLGENGTGKTTFARMLAHVLTQDGGEITKKITVSYKPQYIESSNETVAEALDHAIQKYAAQLITPLKIEPLLESRLSQLSGGELQRVAIAACLQKDADLYLLDEPSAYLDAEQRLVVSKVVRDFMEQKGATAMVVDHDLLFIDYVATKIMVVDGTPAVKGEVHAPQEMEDGMNHFLGKLQITLRRDHDTKRPRINKEDSYLDREQKGSGKYYYA